MNKTIFVGGGSDEREEVAAAISMLRSAGWEITFDWPEEMRRVPVLRDRSHAYQLGGRFEDAILRASIVWILLPRTKSEGAAAELGMARMSIRMGGNPSRGLIVSGGIDDLGRFYPMRAAAQGAVFDDHAAALQYLCGMS